VFSRRQPLPPLVSRLLAASPVKQSPVSGWTLPCAPVKRSGRTGAAARCRYVRRRKPTVLRVAPPRCRDQRENKNGGKGKRDHPPAKSLTTGVCSRLRARPIS